MNEIDFQLTIDEFDRLADMIYRRIGIRFEPKKIYFINHRIFQRMQVMGFNSAAEYIRYLKFSDLQGHEFQNLVNQITINETYFFRDFPQLESFADICLPEVVKQKITLNDNSLRIWSAGCSTGEEPYSIAIILHEILEDVSDWKIEIIASDIDEKVLIKAQAGVYEKRSIMDTPETYLKTYFNILPKQRFEVKSMVKSMVKFIKLNLQNRDEMRVIINCDFIFCRNVLIYFDDISRRQVVDHFYTSLKTSGYIFLGSSESLGRITTAFKLQRSGKFLVYCKE